MRRVPAMLGMQFYLLASGSKGNCFVLRTPESQIVIDCGTTKTYLSRCFQSLGLNVLNSDALLITHGHRDHVSQLKMFAPIEAYAAFGLDRQQHWVKPFQSFQIHDLTVTPLPLSHDAENTVGYVLQTAAEKLVYITDTGYVREDCLDYIRGADYYIMESNHDVGMLMQTRRPYPIKMRILSDSGHLCNEDSARLLSEIVTPRTRSVFLAHLSEEANDPQLALKVVQQQLDGCACRNSLILKAAGQYEILEGGSLHEEMADAAARRSGVLELAAER